MSNSDDGAPIAPDNPTAPDTSNVVAFPSPASPSQTPLQHNQLPDDGEKNTHTHECMTRARGKGENTKGKTKKKKRTPPKPKNWNRPSRAKGVDTRELAKSFNPAGLPPREGIRGTNGKTYVLTIRQERFCLEYLKSDNRTAAYRIAYNCENSLPKSVNQNASRLLNNRNVQRRMTELKAEIAAKTTLSRAWVLERLMENAEMGLGKRKVKLTKATKDGETFETEVTPLDQAAANRALELLGKEAGMFVDRREIGSPGDFARMGDEELRQYVEREQAEIVERMKRTGTDG